LLRPASIQRLLLISALILAAQILIVLKQPETRYFIPIIASMALANAGLFNYLRLSGSPYARFGKVVLAALLALGLGHNVIVGSARARDTYLTWSDNQKLLERAAASRCTLIFYYDVNTPVYDLSFGNAFADNQFGEMLDRLYPGALIYDVFNDRFGSLTAPLLPAEMKSRFEREGCLYLIGSPMERYEDYETSEISRGSISLVARTEHGLFSSVAIYDFKPMLSNGDFVQPPRLCLLKAQNC